LPDLRWRTDADTLDAWREGRTGYPVVDAAMRQLVRTGWIPNRARMIAASFLAKDLLGDWRVGEAHFMRHLLDGDPAANNGNWQWMASVGVAAAPYFRVLSPTAQGKKHDPEGGYVRLWVPELAGVPVSRVHEPWQLSPEEQRRYSCVLGVDYPKPIVDHVEARERALAEYRRAFRVRGARDASARGRTPLLTCSAIATGGACLPNRRPGARKWEGAARCLGIICVQARAKGAGAPVPGTPIRQTGRAGRRATRRPGG